MNNFIVYEQPVAENIRNFLKCEYLHEKINSSLSLESIWSIKSSISALLEMSDFSQRINLKVELLKELEKIGFTLQKLNEDNEIELSKFDAYKTIGEVTKLLNLNSNKSKLISTHTIRFWEKEFKQVKPHIFSGKRRYYDNSSIQILKKIKYLLKEKGMTIKGVKKQLKLNNSKLDDLNNKSINGEVIKTKLNKISNLLKNLKNYG